MMERRAPKMMGYKKTFQELCDDIGINTVFQGTDADEVIEYLILEWLFDYRLCSDDDTTFLRYFRRRFNNLYPRYLEQVRVLTVRENFDPFVTEYYQDLTNRNSEDNLSNTKVTEGENSTTVAGTTSEETETVRTPNLTTASEGTTETDSAGSVATDGTNTTTRTGTDGTVTSGSGTNESDTKADAFAIAYPEANLNGIPTDISSLGTSRTIDYANSESISIGHTEGETSESGSSTTTHNTTDTTTIDEDVATTDHSEGTSSGTVTETGTETTTTEKSGTNGSTTTGSDSQTVTDTGLNTSTETVKGEHKGRHESIADILPRAVRALQNTNEVMWFIESLKVCFDCTALD